MRATNFRRVHTYCPFGVNKIIFFLFSFYARFGMLLKGVGEAFLLSKDEPLTPNIDGVLALWIFRRRAKNTKIDQKSAKIRPLDSGFYFFAAAPSRKVPLEYSTLGFASKRSFKNTDTKPITISSWIKCPSFGTTHFPAKSCWVHFGLRHWSCFLS